MARRAKKKKLPGGLEQNRVGIWQTRIVDPDTGRRARVSTGTRDLAEAIAIAEQRLAEQALRTDAEPSPEKARAYNSAHVTFGLAATHCCEARAGLKGDNALSANTLATDKDRLSHPRKHFGELPLSAITERALKKFIRARRDAGVGDYRIKGELQKIHMVCRYAVAQNALSSEQLSATWAFFTVDSPTNEWKRVQSGVRTDVPKRSDVEKLLKYMLGTTNWRRLGQRLAFVYATGCRPSETVALCLSDVGRDAWSPAGKRDDGRQLKNRNARLGRPIYPPMRPWLKKALRGVPAEGPMFPSWKEDAVHYGRKTRAAAEEAGVPYFPWKQLRDVMTARLEEDGVPLELAARVIGDSPTTLRNHYRAGEAEAMGRRLSHLLSHRA